MFSMFLARRIRLHPGLAARGFLHGNARGAVGFSIAEIILKLFELILGGLRASSFWRAAMFESSLFFAHIEFRLLHISLSFQQRVTVLFLLCLAFRLGLRQCASASAKSPQPRVVC